MIYSILTFFREEEGKIVLLLLQLERSKPKNNYYFLTRPQLDWNDRNSTLIDKVLDRL